LAQKSASVPIFELGISAFGKMPQGRLRPCFIQPPSVAAKLERIARFLAQKSAVLRIFALCFALQNNPRRKAPCFLVPPSMVCKNAPKFPGI
jgi:hypothetical protein